VTIERGDQGQVSHGFRDPAADALLTNDPLALLIGMVLDQQIR
jgi:hypothetical protein